MHKNMKLYTKSSSNFLNIKLMLSLRLWMTLSGYNNLRKSDVLFILIPIITAFITWAESSLAQQYFHRHFLRSRLTNNNINLIDICHDSLDKSAYCVRNSKKQIQYIYSKSNSIIELSKVTQSKSNHHQVYWNCCISLEEKIKFEYTFEFLGNCLYNAEGGIIYIYCMTYA